MMSEDLYVGKRREEWTVIDFAYLAVVAVVAGIIFYATWFVYEFASPLGPIFTRIISYGLWFIGAPLGAALIRKRLSAFLGETLGALVETFIPTIGGFTNLVYGIWQGAFSELVYAAFRYQRNNDPLVGGLAGAAAAPAAIALDYVLFGEIATFPVLVIWTIAAAVSGFIYGFIATKAVNLLVRGE